MTDKTETFITHTQDVKGEYTRNYKNEVQWSAEARGKSVLEVFAKLVTYDDLMKAHFQQPKVEAKP